MKLHGKKLLSLLVALLLAVLPLVSLAEDTEEKTKGEQWRREAIESGLYVKEEYTLQVNSMSGLSEETLPLVQQTMDALRLEVTTFDDIDAVYTHYALLMSGQEVLTVDMRESEEEQWFVTSLLPGYVLTAPRGEKTPDGLLIPISPFSLFTLYVPNLPGGILSLSEEDATYLDTDAARYMFEIGSWVSATQYATDDLYVYDFEELPETDTRDAVSQTFSTNIRAIDLQRLIRLMADVFYDDDQLQEVFANYLSYFGVTRQDMRTFADEWPLAVAALKAQDASLKYTAYYNDQSDIVGFELDVPRLFDTFFCEHLTAKYEAKRDENGLKGIGHGEMLLDTQGSKIEAEFALQEGDLIDDARTDFYSVEAKQTMASGAEVTMLSYYQMDQRVDGEVETIDRHYNTVQMGNEKAGDQAGQSSTDISGTATTTRLSEDGHFEGQQEYVALLTGDWNDGAATEVALTIKTTTGEYTVPDFSGEQVPMLTTSWNELDALCDTVVANGQSAALKALSLLPPDVLQAIGSGMSGK